MGDQPQTGTREGSATGSWTRATEHYDDEKVPRAAAGHTWGPAVVSLIGPTPATEGAHDVDEERVEAHRARHRQIEDVILAVSRDHGGKARSIVEDALKRGLEASGHWPQPKAWVEAVASSIESGHPYNMGTSADER